MRISLPKRLITMSIRACLQASESLHTITKHFWKVSSFSSIRSMLMSPTHLLSSRFLTKLLYGFSAPPSLLYAPPIAPNLITLKIFYKNKNYEAPPLNFQVLMSIYPSAVQMISVFTSQTPATNIHWFKIRLMS